MKTYTFRDFIWSSIHFIPGKHGAAAHPHWHQYRARFWFTGNVDQDWLIERLEKTFGRLHGASLNSIIQPDSSDETVAKWLLIEATKNVCATCFRVSVENDGKRGAEVEV